MLSRKEPFRKRKKPPGKRKKPERYVPFIDKQAGKSNRTSGPDRVPLLTRRHVVKRDHGRCQNCYRPGTQLHHITFRKMGGGYGKHVPENLVLLCQACHQGKNGPHQRHDKRLYWETWAAQKYGLTHEQWYRISVGKQEGMTPHGEGPHVPHGDCPQDRQSWPGCAE